VVGAFGSPTLAIELGSAWVYEDTEIQTLVDSVGVNYGVINYSGDWTYLALYADLRGDFNTDDDFVPWQDNISSGRLSSREEDYLLNVEWEDYFVPFSREQTRLLRNSGVDEPYQQVLTDYFNFWDMPEGNRHRQFINAMVATQISVEYNAPLSQLSTQTVGTSVNSCIFCGSDHYMAVENGGFSRLIEAISEPVRDRVRLESRVTQVDYSDANGPIRVAYRNADGEERVVLANRVLVTVPVGVLKAQTIQFIPDLPSWKRSAIRYMGFGVLNKCILYWDFDAEPTWWPTDKAVLSLITDDDETSGVWTTFFNDRELDNGGHFILSAWIGGDNAIWSEKNQSDKEVVDNVIANLRSMLGRNVPYPDDYIVTRWGQDEFARGSYSFVPVGTADIDDVREDLASPVRGRLFFAGEATDSFYGTVVGARRSGIRSARDIRNSL
jgi:monoamine oxidase